MCPFILLTFICSILLLFVELTAAVISVTFNPAAVSSIHEGQSKLVNFSIKNSNNNLDQLIGNYRFLVDRPDIADIGGDERYFQISQNTNLTTSKKNGTLKYDGSFRVRANFLGYCRITLQKEGKSIKNSKTFSNFLTENKTIQQNVQLVVSVVRDKALISKIFVYSVATIVSISYISMGASLDLTVVSDVLRRPIAPAIGFFCQYVAMPLLSYGIGAILLDETYLRLGLFIFGCSPGGGASNMWAVLLGGNLNLSITMTLLSTLFSFGIMPFWLYTLGRTIFEGTTTSPPVRSILTTLGSMVVFLGIGLLIRRFFPKLSNFCRRILAPFSVAMIIFIIVFGTYSNLYMFKVMTWQMFLATALTVWIGMALGFVISYLFGKPLEDMIAIAIETGVQNTGVSFVVLGLSLMQPDADLASAVPVAASIMTPIPLTMAYVVLKFRNWYLQKRCSIIYSNKDCCSSSNFNDYKTSNGTTSCNNTTSINVYNRGLTQNSDSNISGKLAHNNGNNGLNKQQHKGSMIIDTDDSDLDVGSSRTSNTTLIHP